MKNYKLYSQPFLCFFLNFLLFFFSSPDRILTLLIFIALQIFPVSNSDPFLDSRNRKAGWLNRFSVAPSTSAYLVPWLLCNCHYFEKSISFSSVHSDYIGGFFLLSYILIRMFCFYFINNSIIEHRMKPSCSQCQRKQYNRHAQWGVS